MSENDDWGALADRAEHGELRPIEGTAVTGEQAAADGRALLMNATGANAAEEATRVALGRPKLGEVRDARMWRVRATPVLDDAVANLAKREGRSRSEVIRAAVAEYAQARGV